MTKKILWLVVSGLMVLSLVMAACGQAATEELEEEEVVSADIPKYGGEINVLQTSDIRGFDEAFTQSASVHSMKLTNSEISCGDWAKGPAGTGQTDWNGMNNRTDIKAGLLAESWTVTEPGHIIFKVRQGVHYGLNEDSEASRLMDGREYTAEDLVYNINRHLTGAKHYIPKAVPGFKEYSEVTATDEWTVEFKCNPKDFIWVLSLMLDYATMDMPREVIEEYGDMADWKNSVGTGPFFLTDYVPGSSLTYIRNPNYWETDPVGPGKGNQLPYADGVTQLIIPDESTRMAALRTGQVDWIPSVNRDQGLEIKRTSPGLSTMTFNPYGSSNAIYMRQDNPELPYSDRQVRRALHMAIDYESIIQNLYGGEADLLAWPFANAPGYQNAYLSLDEAPASVQEMYVYDTEKAKQLLADAGYPGGFITEVVVSDTGDNIDYLSIIKDMWQEIGVEMVIVPKETGAYSTIVGKRNYENMILGIGAPASTYARAILYSGEIRYNLSYVDDPLVEEAKVGMAEAVNNLDEAAADVLHKELMKYVLDQAWAVPRPAGYTYKFWWPWLKNYHGEDGPGYGNGYMWVRYVWLDQELKKEMGY